MKAPGRLRQPTGHAAGTLGMMQEAGTTAMMHHEALPHGRYLDLVRRGLMSLQHVPLVRADCRVPSWT